jgi:hypothetical protein
MDTPALTEFLNSLVAVKQTLYKQFLRETENSHQQNVDIIINDYPKYLARWSSELCKGPTNIPPPAAKADEFLLSALSDLKVAMEKLIAEDDFSGDICKYYIKTLFVTYPYAMNMNSLS